MDRGASVMQGEEKIVVDAVQGPTPRIRRFVKLNPLSMSDIHKVSNNLSEELRPLLSPATNCRDRGETGTWLTTDEQLLRRLQRHA